MFKANNAKTNKLVKGLINDKTIKDMIIWSCIVIIQLLLCPNFLNNLVGDLSTKGAHKNFKEYVSIIQLIKPIKLKSTPISLNHAVKVTKIRTYGSPDANPYPVNARILFKFLLIIARLKIFPSQTFYQDQFFLMVKHQNDQQ